MIAPLSRLSPTMPTTSQQEGHYEQLNPLHRSNTEHLQRPSRKHGGGHRSGRTRKSN